MAKKRVLHVVHGFPPEASGGTELNAFYLAKELSRKFSVHVFTGSNDSSKTDYSVARDLYCGLRVMRIKLPYGRPILPAEYYLNPRIEGVFEDCLDEVRPSLVHIHHLLGLSTGIIERTAARRIPMILQIRDFYYLCPRTFLVDYSGELCEGPQDRLRCAECVRDNLPDQIRTALPPQEIFSNTVEHVAEYVKNALKLADTIICPTRFVKSVFSRYGIPTSKMQIQPDGVKEIPMITRKESDQKKSFGFLGHISQYKGISVLLEAFSRLDQSIAELLVFGGGELSFIENLKTKYGSFNIRFMGEYDHDDLPSVLSKLDILVQPSLCHETYSLIVHEALAAGVPVLVSDISAQRDDVRNGVNGFRFRAGDSEDLRRWMEMLINDSVLMERLKRSRTKVVTVKEQCKRIGAIYDGLITKRLDAPKESVLATLGQLRQRLENENGELESKIFPFMDPMRKLLALYMSRPDLQTAYPEVMKGEYSRLLQWAKNSLEDMKDPACAALVENAWWYRENEWLGLGGKLKETEAKIIELDSKIQHRDSTIEGLQSTIEGLQSTIEGLESRVLRLESDKAEATSRLDKARAEIAERDTLIRNLQADSLQLSNELALIKGSFGYRLMRFYGRGIDHLFRKDESR